MKKIKTIFFFILIFYCSPLSAAALNNSDYANLKPLRQIENLFCESYLDTNQGQCTLFGFDFKTFFNKNFYFPLSITGAVGGKIGGYGQASFGLGYRQNINNNLDFDLKFMLGTGGGGGLNAGHGFLVSAKSGLSYELTQNFYLDFGIGYLTFPTGDLSTTTINLGCSIETNQLFLEI